MHLIHGKDSMKGGFLRQKISKRPIFLTSQVTSADNHVLLSASTSLAKCQQFKQKTRMLLSNSFVDFFNLQ